MPRSSIVFLILGVSIGSATGQEQDWNEAAIRPSKVPAKLLQKAEKEAPGVKFSTTFRDNEQGYRFVGKKANGSSVSVRIDREVQLERLWTWGDVAPGKVPKAVSNALQAEIRKPPQGSTNLAGFTTARAWLVDEVQVVRGETKTATFYEFYGKTTQNPYYTVQISQEGEVRKVRMMLGSPALNIRKDFFPASALSGPMKQAVTKLVPAVKLTRVVKEKDLKFGTGVGYSIFGRGPGDRAYEFIGFPPWTITRYKEEIGLDDTPKAVLEAVRKYVDQNANRKGFRPNEAWRDHRIANQGQVAYYLYGDDAEGLPIQFEVEPDGQVNQSRDIREDYEVGSPIPTPGVMIPTSGFAVLAARYGNVGWIDVTDAVRAAVPSGVLKVGNGGPLPDPSYGQPKALLLLYSVDGKVGLSVAFDGQDCPLPPKDDPSKLVEVPPRGFHLLAARFGAGVQWVDVSGILWAKVSGDRLAIMASEAGLTDAEIAKGRAVAVAYSVDGIAGLSVEHESKKITLPLADSPINSSAIEAWKLDLPDAVSAVAFTPDGRQVVAGVQDGTVRVVDAMTGRETHRLEGHPPGRVGLAVSTNGNQLLSAGYDKLVRLWDLKTDKVQGIFRGHTEDLHGVAFAPNARQAASVAWEKSVRIWDVAASREVRKLEGHSEFIDGVAYTSDGKNLVTSSWDGTLRVWDASNGREIRKYQNDAGRLGALALSKDGRLAFVGSDDGGIRVVEIATARERNRPSLKGDSGWAIAASPEGGRLLVADGTSAILWDVKSDRMVLRLDRHTARLRVVAFSPDGKKAVSGGEDRTLRFWNLPDPVRDDPSILSPR